ncbi:MAG: hypothetical protein R6U95_04005 [Bacteroidales bacterium]
METFTIDILNPKAKKILKGLADLKLISIKKKEKKSDFIQMLSDLRENVDSPPTLNDITTEVESVRKSRYDQ